ncbi:cell division regulator GpsB [Streptococcus caprae]|uniref:Cell cycle protein GpsB n=1 Tax=Streptococcus caprae TaxID=1640501 RepID=A0ABV8CTY3_9STRE
MASIIYSPKEIFEQDFKKTMRGYDQVEVDEFLDNIIKDYETFMAQIEFLTTENDELKRQLSTAESSPSTTPYVNPSVSGQFTETGPVATTATNFDILKRISRLEKEVFGKQIVE